MVFGFSLCGVVGPQIWVRLICWGVSVILKFRGQYISVKATQALFRFGGGQIVVPWIGVHKKITLIDANS